jgi:hypothetical protein
MKKLSLHIYFTGNQYDALLPFRNNALKFLAKHVRINISLEMKEASIKSLK